MQKRRRPAGRRLEELCAKIRAANPTGRGLSARAQRERYEEKARLQSLLIEEHGELVRACAHDDMPGIVSLSVPALEESASHAVVDALSARARAWIASALEVERRAPAATVEARGTAPAASALERGVRYLREYDYECAERELRSVVTGSRASPSRPASKPDPIERGASREAPPRSARPASKPEPVEPRAERERAMDVLLELLVDHLGRDDDALELAEQHSAFVTSVRAHGFVGTAAARTGRLDLALASLARAGQAAAPLALVATTALARREHARAWEALQLLRRAASAAELHDVEQKIRALVDASSLQDLEDDRALLTLAEAVTPAHDLLLQRREMLRARREEGDYQRHLERLLELRANGSADADKLESLLGALLHSPLADGDRPRLEAIARETSELRAHATVARIVTLHDAGQLEEAALAYLRLAREARERALVAAKRPFFGLVDRIAAEATSAHAAARAAAAWASRDWERIAPHAPLLMRVEELRDHVERLRPAPASSGGETKAPRAHHPPTLHSRARTTHASLLQDRLAHLATPPLVADETARIAGREVTCLLFRRTEREHELWLDPVDASDAPRTAIRIASSESWIPTALLGDDGALAIADANGRLHVLADEDGAMAWREGPPLEIVSNRMPMGCRGTRLVSLSGRHPGDTGSILHGVMRPAVVVARPDALVVFDGSPPRAVPIPAGLTEVVALESPLGAALAPVLLERTAGDARPMVWCFTEGAIWHAFRLRERIAPTIALTLPGRGIALAAAQPDGLAVQKLVVRSERIERGDFVVVERGIGLVRDRGARRVWAVQLARGDEQATLRPLALQSAR